MHNVKVIINDKIINTEPNKTILEVALENNIYIPNLCHHSDLKPVGACRLCLVAVEKIGLATACNTFVTDRMNIHTETNEIKSMRKTLLELLLVDHPHNCLECRKNSKCELQKVARYVGIGEENFGLYEKKGKVLPIDCSNPFFDYDHNKCILCGICVRTCDELQEINAIDFINRSSDTTIAPFAKTSLIESNCESCGECVSRCPTAALSYKTYQEANTETLTVCPYCGCGCALYLGSRGNQIVSARGDKSGAANHGSLCVKGRFGFEFVNSKKRLTTPLIKKDNKFVESTWDDALNIIADKLHLYKGEQFAVFASARMTNEDNYVLQKFTRVAMKSNHIDHCARLCHAPTVSGLAKSFGSGAMTNSNDDIGDAHCIFSIGSNTTETHPTIALQVKRAVSNGAKLIVANPKRITLCRHAAIHLQNRPGTDAALLMGMAKLIVDEHLYDEVFIKQRTEHFDELHESLKSFSLEIAEKITGVKADLIKKAARLYATHKPSSIIYAMGITQHTSGTDNVLAVSNLALLTGNIGMRGAGVNPLRGQNNVQGACDMGALPNVYPGYQQISNPEVIAKFEKDWGCSLNPNVGLTLTEIFHEVEKEKIKMLYIVGENPVLSEADSNHVKHCLKKADFIVVQDIFFTETAEYADVVLPATSFAEKDGTFTNTERRVQRIRKAIQNVGSSRGDWEIICDLAKMLGADGFDFGSATEIMDEIASVTPIYGGINYNRIEKTGIQWPCVDKNDVGKIFLYEEKFSTPNGKGQFFAFFDIEDKKPAELPDDEYPFLLTTDRSLFHYHTGTMTRKVDGLNKLNPNEWIIIHPIDAEKLNVQDGEIVKVISRRGEVFVKVKMTDVILPGVVSMTFHFVEVQTNKLTNCAVDPIAKIPETKVCAVRIERIKKCVEL